MRQANQIDAEYSLRPGLAVLCGGAANLQLAPIPCTKMKEEK
jgi:hypothetical protein